MRRLLATLALAGSLLLATAASAEVVPQKSIAGVSLGMSQKQVRVGLGKPNWVKRSKNEFGPYAEFHYRRLVVSFQGLGSATNIASTRRSERLANGIGIGSTKAAVKKHVRGVSCSTLLCHVGRYRPGKRVTTFRLKKNRVVEIDVGFVID
jgi:hypothetical protein